MLRTAALGKHGLQQRETFIQLRPVLVHNMKAIVPNTDYDRGRKKRKKKKNWRLLDISTLWKALTFEYPCIVNIIPNYNQQDATFLDSFISADALHVSGGSSAHHQEHITVHTASGIVNQYCC